MSTENCPGRRNFLKQAAIGATAIALTAGVQKAMAVTSRTGAGTAPLNKWPGRVVINFNKNCPVGNVDATATQITLIKTMTDDSIKLLSGTTTVAAAWKAIFPATLSATSKIAIKIPLGHNSSRTAPHWASVQAMVEGLVSMTFGSTPFPVANITIYDGNGTNAFDTAGFTAARFPGVSFVFDSRGTYSDGAENNATPGVKQQYCTALRNADFLINVFSPRGHSAYAGNFTLGFKNHYGTYPCAYHDIDNTQQYIRNLNCTGPVYAKNVLSVCCGLYAQYENVGPGGNPSCYLRYAQFMDASIPSHTEPHATGVLLVNPTTIIMSTDPVSAEMQTIKMMRIQGKSAGLSGNGLPYTVADMPSYLKASAGIVVTDTTSSKNWPPNPSAPTVMDNIGIINESQMSIRRIINGMQTTDINDHSSRPVAQTGPRITATSLKSQRTTFIEFGLPVSAVGLTVAVEIYDMSGKQVARLSHNVNGVLNHLSWNQKDSMGGAVGRGTYVIRLLGGLEQLSTKVIIG